METGKEDETKQNREFFMKQERMADKQAAGNFQCPKCEKDLGHIADQAIRNVYCFTCKEKFCRKCKEVSH
jgi:hypothetical protein